MLKDDLLINCFLELHKCLQKLADLKYIGKDHLNSLANTMIEIGIIEAENKKGIVDIQKLIAEFSIKKMEETMIEGVVKFEDQFLKADRQVIEKLEVISKNLVFAYQPHWPQYQNASESVKQYYLALCQLNALANQLIVQYQQQYKHIQNQWELIRTKIFQREPYEKLINQIKILGLHISYEANVKGGLIEYWGKALPGLQSKRYKV